MSTVAKVAGGTVVLGGGTGGASYVAYSHYNTTIEESLLGVDGISFLNTDTTDDDAKWDLLVKSYKNSTEKNKIEGLSLSGTSGSDESNRSSLKNKCKELLKIKMKFGDVSSIQEQVKRWCKEIKDVEDALKKEGKEILDESGFESTFNSKKSDTGFAKFITGEESPTPPLDDSKKDSYKQKCKKEFEKKPDASASSDYETGLSNARNYCVKAQAS